MTRTRAPGTGAAGRPGRLGIGLVGAGRVGAVLASALRSTGHAVVGASAVSPDSRDRAELLLPGVPVLEIEEVVERAELVLIAVPDDVLPDLVDGLARLGRWQPGQLVVHTSGRHGTEALAPAAAAGAIVLAIHPAMTFTGTSIDLSRLTGCPFAVTAATPVLPIAQALVVEIGGEPFILDEALRPVYHAALAHGADHLRTLVAQAGRALAAAGIDGPGTVLTPLLSAALDAALRDGEAGLAGPVVRGEVSTVRAHLDALGALAGQDLADVVETYRHLARVTTRRALRTGRVKERTAAELLDVLAEPAGDPARGPAGAVSNRGVAAGPAPAGERARRPGDAVPDTDASSGPAPAHRTAPVRVSPDDPARGVPDDDPEPSASTTLEPVLAQSRTEISAALRSLPGTRALVMTMGALHDGHLALVREARRQAQHVVVSVLVDPLELGEDAVAYPRDLEADLALLAQEGVDVVFAPGEDFLTSSGLTVVGARPGTPPLLAPAKLLGLVRPDVLVMGRTDVGRLAAVRTLVRELEMGVDVVDVPARRDPDGLVVSSRNSLLGAAGRKRALVLSRALAAGRLAAESGGDVGGVLAAARAVLAGEEGVAVEYLELVDATTLDPLNEPRPAGGTASGPRPALLAVAAVVTGVRLLDTMFLDL